ncbi:MAG: biotin-dependent carboxyltransferase family protein [Chloroflexota bacterium]|nr:biotin-dependent carboxyltransferase family protein [Chloroflexota bacterium]
MIKFLNSGILSSFQDKGRYGKKKFGVSRSGCLDVFSFELSNRLLGNSHDEPAIEILGGFSCVFLQETVISITGPLEIFSVNDNFIYQTNSSIKMNIGDKLDIPFSNKGNLFYLSVSGGFKINKVMNSYSYHQPSNITDELKISNGDIVKLNNNIQSDLLISDNTFFEKRIFNNETIRIIYNEDINVKEFKNIFEQREFRISDQINRQGIRLKGEPLDFFKDQNEISSEVSAGTVQLPPDGIPIILLNDSQTTGGYKKIGSIPRFQLSKICQKPISSRVKFSGISLSESISEFRKMHLEFNKINIQNYTNRVLEVNGRMISVLISQNNSIISIADNQQFEIIEEKFE